MYDIGPSETESYILLVLAIVGAISIAGGIVWGILWLIEHVRIV